MKPGDDKDNPRIVECRNMACPFYRVPRKYIAIPVGNGLYMETQVTCRCGWAVYKPSEYPAR